MYYYIYLFICSIFSQMVKSFEPLIDSGNIGGDSLMNLQMTLIYNGFMGVL